MSLDAYAGASRFEVDEHVLINIMLVGQSKQNL
jgi:hypothetical protein